MVAGLEGSARIAKSCGQNLAAAFVHFNPHLLSKLPSDCTHNDPERVCVAISSTDQPMYIARVHGDDERCALVAVVCLNLDGPGVIHNDLDHSEQ